MSRVCRAFPAFTVLGEIVDELNRGGGVLDLSGSLPEGTLEAPTLAFGAEETTPEDDESL